MRKITFYFILLFTTINVNSQILNVRQCIQEQDQWCWVGVSQCLLNYYGKSYTQCEIAEYARSVITWQNFGSTNCCKNPSGACNYWNYNWGYDGSIQDILEHLGEIPNTGTLSLTIADIINELNLSRPFIIRWGWKSSGGHFIVGHGLVDNTLYYMDPWFGEGFKFASYDWVKDNINSTWTHTNKMNVSPSSMDVLIHSQMQFKITPNPSKTGNFVLENLPVSRITYQIYTTDGKLIEQGNTMNSTTLQLSIQEKGIFILKLLGTDVSSTQKLIVQ